MFNIKTVTLLSIIFSCLLFIPSATFGQKQTNEWVEVQTKLSGIKATWKKPPAGIINKKLTTGMILGNIDIGVVAGDKLNRQTFYFGKSDFWGASVKNPDVNDKPNWQNRM